MLKSILFSLLSGILLILGWPDLGFPGILFVAFIPLFWAIYKIKLSEKKKKAIKVSLLVYISIVVWNIGTTYWIWNASPGGFLLTAFISPLFTTFFVFLVYKCWDYLRPIPLIIVFISTWIVHEKLFLYWDINWPWLNLGNAFGEFINWIQWYEYTGIHGGTFWILAVNFLFFFILINTEKRLRFLTISIAAILIPIIISYIILDRQNEEKLPSASVLIIQPNVDPYSKKYDLSNQHFINTLSKYLDKHQDDKIDLVIAPETYLPHRIIINDLKYSDEISELKTVLNKRTDSDLITGIFAIDINRNKSIEDNKPRYTAHNTALFLNETQSKLYHKSKLVPGVESFPYEKILKPLLGNALIDLGGSVLSLSKSKKREVFVSEKNMIRAAPVICFESVFGDFIVDFIRNGSNLITVITNDGWWKNTQGHRQHLLFSKLRAVETRRYVARSANTGISSIINTKGEILKSLDYEVEGSIVGEVKLNSEMTFYSKYGDYIARISILISSIFLLFALSKRLKPKI